ncbi:phosphopantetheine-binding protein [Rheinheimera aquimaris]|uniref:Phosphopantetheine-binding protein n=1 Tax=Rheinheimera aquimaris TaxID=412437 RepID=A0ABN1DMH5_9GAMM|nr:phosphopantetheine-binding protein [Rheinheimera aquimaris]MCB5213018.1 phosphopantetheine-binding protein [Rheinheimera aquimaris]
MDSLKLELKQLIISTLELEDITPDDIDDDAPLFVDGLGLDSIDALELGQALKKQYNIKPDADSEKNKQHFASLNTLAQYVKQQQQ